MKEAIIGLVSAFGVVIIKGIIDYVIARRKRKDDIEDKEDGKTKEILNAIQGVKDDIEDVRKELKATQEDIKKVRAEQDETRIVQSRIRILQFADDLYLGEPRHGKGHFDQIMKDITDYNDYCESHPKFENDITDSSIRIIKEKYEEHLRKNDFFGGGD